MEARNVERVDLDVHRPARMDGRPCRGCERSTELGAERDVWETIRGDERQAGSRAGASARVNGAVLVDLHGGDGPKDCVVLPTEHPPIETVVQINQDGPVHARGSAGAGASLTF